MPSGYEQSPDYGGPEPRPRLWLVAGGILLLAAGTYWFF